MTNSPNPGSKEARTLGCRCPILDNNNGEGLGNGQFWIAEDCPVHGHKNYRLPGKQKDPKRYRRSYLKNKLKDLNWKLRSLEKEAEDTREQIATALKELEGLNKS